MCGEGPRVVPESESLREITVAVSPLIFRKAAAIAADQDTTIEELCERIVSLKIQSIPLASEAIDEQ